MRTAGILGLVLVLVFGAAFSPASQRRSRKPKSHSGKSASQLRNDLKSLQAQKNALKRELSNTKHQTHEVLQDIEQVDAKLDKIQDELDDTTSRLTDSRHDQAQLATDLRSATDKLEATRQQVRERLKHMYVHGNASFLSALVGTKTVGDIASRQYLMRMIAKKDRQLFTDYQQLQRQVADRKQRQDALVVRIRGLVRQEASQQEAYQDAREQKTEVLHGLKEKQGKLQGLLAQFEADERDITAQIAAFARRKRRPGEKQLPAFHGRFSRPVGGRITSTFGMRYHPILHITRLHAGIDFGVPSGTPIHAVADGEVISARYSSSFGNVVVIDHGGGIATLYAHCSRLLVRSGQMVHRGETIAASGATGLAAGPHLHFEVRVNGRPVNPMGWL